MNASDDRSAASLRSRLVSAMQMQPVFGDKRPVLVVVDEIDGLAPDAVEELISMIKATPDRQTGLSGDEDVGAKGKSKGKGTKSKGGTTFKDNKQGLTRPVICICNDMVRSVQHVQCSACPAPWPPGRHAIVGLSDIPPPPVRVFHCARGCCCVPLPVVGLEQYAPSVRALREYAQVVTFPKTPIQRLTARLKDVCAREHLVATADALTQLCTLSGNDIRTCLNTLQFIRYRHGVCVLWCVCGVGGP
jgi:chromosome transmission fidelity protein 18